MRPRRGCLVKRGATYSLRTVINGHATVKALRTPEGTPCRTLTDARLAFAEETRELVLLNRKQALERAIRELAGVKAEIDAIRNPKAKLVQVWQAYLKSGERPNSGYYTLRNYQRHTRDFVVWLSKRYPTLVFLDEVTRSMASEYSRHLADNYSGSTHNRNVSFLRLLWRTLIYEGQNPFERIRMKPKESVPHKPLTTDQLQRVLSLAKGQLHTFLLVGIFTALRRKDACLLRWNSIDMEKNVITVTPSKTASRSHKVVCIPIHPSLRARLETTFKTSEYVMPRMAFWYDHNPAHISRRIRDLFEACGIKTRMEIEGRHGTKKNNKSIYSYHSLRYTMGQQMIDLGYSLDQIAQVLGHTNTTMSLHYSTLSDTVRERAILSLPSIATA